MAVISAVQSDFILSSSLLRVLSNYNDVTIKGCGMQWAWLTSSACSNCALRSDLVCCNRSFSAWLCCYGNGQVMAGD